MPPAISVKLGQETGVSQTICLHSQYDQKLHQVSLAKLEVQLSKMPDLGINGWNGLEMGRKLWNPGTPAGAAVYKENPSSDQHSLWYKTCDNYDWVLTRKYPAALKTSGT